MDILYIHPPQNDKNFSYLIFPLGIPALIDNLKKVGAGFPCPSIKGINYPLEKQINKKFSLKKFLLRTKPKIILIDFHWYVHLKGMLGVAKICKQVNSEVKIIVGGYSATVFAEEILKYRTQNTEYCRNRPLGLLNVGAIHELPVRSQKIQNPKSKIHLVDYVIKGESELPLVELVRCILNKEENKISAIPNLSYYKDGGVKHNSFTYTAKNLDKLNFTDLSFMRNFKKHFFLHSSTNKLIYGDMPTYYLVIGRGCPFNCYFCFGSKVSQTNFFNRNIFVKRKVESIISDIEKLKSYGVKRFHFNLDLQLLGKENYLKFFKKLKEENFKIALINDCFFIPDEIFIKEFVKAGDKKNSKIFLTLFCGQEEIRKKLGRNITNKELFKFLEVLKKHSVNLEIFFQPNLPDESFTDFKKTITLAKKISNFYPAELLSMQMFPVPLDPYSPYAINSHLKEKIQNLKFKIQNSNNWHLFNYGYKNLSKELIKKEQFLWNSFAKKLFYKKLLQGIVFKKRIAYFKQYSLNLINDYMNKR